jgi:osmoprotectant transport system substrate-binding protein
MQRATRPLILRSLLSLLLALPTACSVSIGVGSAVERTATPAIGDDAITIASFDFPESVLLAEIYAQALESEKFPVKRAFDLGPRELVQPALERGLVEFVPEYLGSALGFVTRGTVEASSDVDATHRKLADAFDTRGITVLEPAPAQDVNGLAVTAQTAATYKLKTISDLAPIAPQLVLGGPPECPSRPLCLPGLQRTYGLRFKRFQGLDAGGPYTSAGLASGQIDVALLFTTDWNIRRNGFVLLEDDRGLQPAENVTPVVRNEIVAAYGSRFTEVIDAVSAKLTTEELRELNRQVGLEAKAPSQVARTWLRSKTLLPG